MIEDGKTKTDTTHYIHGPGVDELLAIEQRVLWKQKDHALHEHGLL